MPFYQNFRAHSVRQAESPKNSNWVQLKEQRTPVMADSFTSLQTTTIGTLYNTPEKQSTVSTFIGLPPGSQLSKPSTFRSLPSGQEVVYIEHCPDLVPGEAIFLIPSSSLDRISSSTPLSPPPLQLPQQQVPSNVSTERRSFVEQCNCYPI